MVDHRADLFSWGIVLFECLTGQFPFQGDSTAAILHAVSHELAPHLGLYQAANADKLDGIARKLLEKSPAARHQTASDVRKDLQEF
jgi:serine/threonine-protein kinase